MFNVFFAHITFYMQTLSPIIWFQFFNKEEDYALQAWEESMRINRNHSGDECTSLETVAKLPAALLWVARICDPQTGLQVHASSAQQYTSVGMVQTCAPTASLGSSSEGFELAHAVQPDPSTSVDGAESDANSEDQGTEDDTGKGTHGRNKYVSFCGTENCHVESHLRRIISAHWLLMLSMLRSVLVHNRICCGRISSSEAGKFGYDWPGHAPSHITGSGGKQQYFTVCECTVTGVPTFQLYTFCMLHHLSMCMVCGVYFNTAVHVAALLYRAGVPQC